MRRADRTTGLRAPLASALLSSVLLAPLPTAAQDLEAVDLALIAGERDDARARLVRFAREGTLADARGWLLLGVLRREEGALEEAAAALEEGLARHPTDRDLATELGVTRLWQHRLPDALAAYARALRHHPEHGPAVVGHARLLGWTGRPAAAQRALTAWLRAHPDDIDARVTLGDLRRAELDRSGALAEYDRALALDGTREDALRGRDEADRVVSRRLRVRAGAVLVDRAPSPTASVSYAHDLDPRHRWFLEAGTVVGGLPGVAPGGVRGLARAGLSVAASRELRLGLGYRLELEALDHSTHAVELEAGWTMRPGLSLHAAARPGSDDRGRIGVLAVAGLQLADGPRWGSLSVYHWEGPGPRTTSAVLTVAVPLGPLELRLGGGVGRQAEAWTGTALLRTQLRLDHQLALALDGEAGWGVQTRFATSLELEWAF